MSSARGYQSGTLRQCSHIEQYLTRFGFYQYPHPSPPSAGAVKMVHNLEMGLF